MKLADALKEVEVIIEDDQSLTKQEMETDFKKIAYHTDEVTPATLFVCIQGYQTDGHDYAQAAVDKGAKVLIVERFLSDIAVPQILVKNSRKALAVIAANFFGHPSEAMHIFGVTGTNGKTTITYMTEQLFRNHGLDTGLIGTVMVKNKEIIEESILTTPESEDLQRYLAQMRNNGVSHVSMEVSSSALDLDRVAQTAFDIVAFTNINHDHIELHGSFQSYFDAKASLIRKASEQSIALLNIDEPLLIPLINQTEAQVVTFGVESPSAKVCLSDIDMSTGKPSFTVTIKEPLRTLSGQRIDPTSFSVKLQIPGYHSIYNATTAVITALLSDLPMEYVKAEIGRFKGVERRFHVLYDQEFTVIDDLLLNANNVDSCMMTVEKMAYNSLHIVHAIRGNNGPELNRENAEALVKWLKILKVDQLILTTSESHVKEKDQVMKEERDAFLKVMEQAGISVDTFSELKEALALGPNQTNHGDLLLISGARGMDHGAKLTLELMKERYPYVDQEAIKAVLDKKVVGMKSVSGI